MENPRISLIQANDVTQLMLETESGFFLVAVETKDTTNHDSAYLMYQPKGSNECFEIAEIRDVPNTDKAEIMLFQNLGSEIATNTWEVSPNEFTTE